MKDALKSDPAYSLTSSVKPDTSNSLIVNVTNMKGNEINLNFIYNYTSMSLNKGISDTISKSIKMRTSNVETSNELFYYGIGTFRGYCIRIISCLIVVNKIFSAETQSEVKKHEIKVWFTPEELFTYSRADEEIMFSK